MSKQGAKLGQHFLRSASAVSAMIDAAHIDSETTVLEIGPGEGVLTKELLAHAKRVIAIEKDSSLVIQLRETFAKEIANERLILVEDDFRNVNVTRLLGSAGASAIREGVESLASRTNLYGERSEDGADKEADRPSTSYVVAANIPYYITGEIIRTLLTSAHQPKHIALLIQKEVATRIVARDKKESILSLSVKAYGTPHIVKTVPRGSFSPPPKVDSAILSVENISRSFFTSISEERFFEIIRTAFGSKRKMLVGNLSPLFDKEKIIAACSSCEIAANARAEDVPLEKWRCLTEKIRP